MAVRHQVGGSAWEEKAHALAPLTLGKSVQVQNQTGPHANKWDLSGVVTEVLDYEAYLVKIDGTGRVSKQNRRYLKPIRTYREILMGRESNSSPSNSSELVVSTPVHSKVSSRVSSPAVSSPLSLSTAVPVELFDSGHVLVYGDMSGQTSFRSGGCQPPERPDNVVRLDTERGGISNSHSENEGRVEGGAQTTVPADGSGPGILCSNDENVSVAKSRGRQAAKVPSQLVVGNPQGWHFNHAKGR